VKTIDNTTIATADFEVAVAALAEAGVQHAQLRAHYAEAVLSALAATRPAICSDHWDEDTTCALPAGHNGWHASAPSYDPETGPQSGSTWTPTRTGSDYHMRRSG
jgi:hypothetical protein